MADVTLGTGIEGLRRYLLNGCTSGVAGSAENGRETLVAFMKAQSGDFKIKCSPATATPLVSECAAAAPSRLPLRRTMTGKAARLQFSPRQGST